MSKRRCLYLIINNAILVTFCSHKNSLRHEKCIWSRWTFFDLTIREGISVIFCYYMYTSCQRYQNYIPVEKPHNRKKLSIYFIKVYLILLYTSTEVANIHVPRFSILELDFTNVFDRFIDWTKNALLPLCVSNCHYFLSENVFVSDFQVKSINFSTWV